MSARLLRSLRVWMTALCLCTGLARVAAQSPALEAELPQELKANTLRTGSDFVLKLRAPWDGKECHLAPGALLHAAVQSTALAAGGQVVELHFTVAAPCGDREPVPLVLTSLLAPPKVETNMEQFPGFGSIGIAGAGTAASAATFNGSDAMRGTAQVVTTSTVSVTKLPTTVTLGEVWHLPRIRLILPSKENETSELATSRPPLRLPEGAVFVLQPALHSSSMDVGVTAVTGRLVPLAPPSARPFLRACRSGACSTYPAHPTPVSAPSSTTAKEFDLAPLGFRPEHDREVAELDPGSTVHFLGDHELLLTFPTHALVRRTGRERPTDEPRSLRAVLLHLPDGAPERELDWDADDHGSNVWPVAGNLVVHEGRALKMYGPGMEILSSLPLDLPLFALRASPDGQHLLLGELHELHTPEDHRALVENDKHGPQEEVLWSVLDGHLHRIAALGKASSYLPIPVVLNDGLVELRKGRDPEWFLVSRPWAGGHDKQLGTLASSCVPILGSLASDDLMTVTTCDTGGDGMHTYVTREDGSPVLEQAFGGEVLPPTFQTATGAGRAAVLLTRASDAYQRGLLFHLSAIQSQSIVVFGAQRGQEVTRVTLPEMALYRQPFALSPDGQTLAVICGQHLYLYTLPL